jgi:hypothetical protein
MCILGIGENTYDAKSLISRSLDSAPAKVSAIKQDDLDKQLQVTG